MNEQNQNKKVMLVILDGWGLTPISEGNATLIANTPTLDYLYATYPRMSLAASGLEVGLNRGEMGNSEVGHLNIGTGRVVWESLPRIDYAIESGDFYNNPTLTNSLEAGAKSRLHLIGLVSSGGVHSHLRHIVALLKAAKERQVREVYLHFISDGRDTSTNSAPIFIKELEAEMRSLGTGKIATVIGRYWAMDRDKRAERTTAAYNLFTKGEGKHFASALAAIDDAYKSGKGDEFVEAAVIDPNGVVRNEDSVIFFNFRADRMRQLVESFITNNYQSFTLGDMAAPTMCSMTQYEKSYELPILFEPVDLRNCLADVLEANGKTQTHIAETEKYAHVTYFFNGGREDVHKGEKQVMVKSPKVATYDLQPEMSASEVSDRVIEALESQVDFIVVNYANGDMVGHTGVLKAGIIACETIDGCLRRILAKASQMSYNCIVTADHGNCELMVDPVKHQPSTEHTTSPVPFVFMNFAEKPFEESPVFNFSESDLLTYSAEPYQGVLSDLSATVLSLMDIDVPKEMGGINLVEGI